MLAVTLGGAIPSALLEILGAAVATGVPGATTVTGLTPGFPSWFIVPYLIFAMFQLFAINTLDLYSSGVTLQSLVPRLRRLQCVPIDTVICGAFVAYAVFSSRFFPLLTDFLLFIIFWLGPWCAIYLVDSLLRRNRYDHLALLDERGGRYFRNGGVHWPGIIALGLRHGCRRALAERLLALRVAPVEPDRRFRLQRLPRADRRRRPVLAARPQQSSGASARESDAMTARPFVSWGGRAGPGAQADSYGAGLP